MKQTALTLYYNFGLMCFFAAIGTMITHKAITITPVCILAATIPAVVYWVKYFRNHTSNKSL